MNQFYEPAIILNITPLKESDLIVTFLGRNLGKASAVAHAARRSKRRFAGGIDLFDCGELELSHPQKQDAMYLLQSIHKKEPWLSLRSSLSKISLASLCLELTNSFTVVGDAQGGALLFNPLFLTLRSLSSTRSENESRAISCYFTLHLLKVSGFNLLDSDIPLAKITHQWFEQMLSANSPIIPHEEQITKEGLNKSLNYAEQILGYPLNSRIISH